MGVSNFARFERKNTNRVFVGVVYLPNDVYKKTLRDRSQIFYGPRLACKPSLKNIILFSGIFQKSDSENYNAIHNFFVYEAILTNNSSKCLYLRVLKAYINRIRLMEENNLSTNG